MCYMKSYLFIYVQFSVSDVFISLALVGTINWDLEALDFCHIIFFHVYIKAHGLALTHRAFVGFLALWAFLVGGFLALWAFLAPTHVGQGQALWVGLNCQL